MGASFWLMIFKITSTTNAFAMSSLLLITMSRTLLLNGTMDPWLKELGACCTITPHLFNFWVRRSTLPSMFLIMCPTKHCMGILRILNGMEINMMWAIFKFLVVCAMHIYPSLFTVNWIAKPVSVFSWGIVRYPRLIGSGVLIRKK